MAWYKRLRYRLIGIQFLVVVIGMGVMILAIPFITTGDEAVARRAFFIAIGIAGVGSLLAGAIASFILWRTLVVPLRTLAHGSQRIANGRYDERVPFPSQSGEAMQQLATNFNQMADTLQAVEKQRVAMINNVAHELRTPLAGLRGMLEGLEDGVFAADTETFALMGREIGRLSRLTEDIQNLSRVEEGAIQLDVQEFVMCGVVQRVISHLQTQANEKKITFIVNEASSPMLVWGDCDRTAQILTNLVSNGVRYTPEGGTVQLDLYPVGQWAHVRVQDTGIGIDATDLPYIFERFYRADRSRSRKSGGSGIGLTIARRLAWAMGGGITAESKGERHGATFTLMLPLHNLSQMSPTPSNSQVMEL